MKTDAQHRQSLPTTRAFRVDVWKGGAAHKFRLYHMQIQRVEHVITSQRICN